MHLRTSVRRNQAAVGTSAGLNLSLLQKKTRLDEAGLYVVI